jgi:predicted outer membrane repeat protein
MGSIAGTSCIQCHNHVYGFAHGTAEGTACIECHGHDAGTNYDPDMSVPYTPGSTASQGRGSYQSHSTHTETDSDDLRGPGLYCDSCHDINNFPYFKSGTDSNGDGKFSLSETDVCDTCHSPGGTYDGVNDSVIGAKNNWQNGVYSGSSLVSGKEKWCAGCHDEVPSVINTVSAPNVIGDEDGAYTYGTGWGFYKTGHGLPNSETYPTSGGVTAGAEKDCLDCHDSTLSHIDGLARTFDCGDGCDSTEYRQSYRLKLIGGQDPMLVPWIQNISNSADNYRLCTQTGCHDSGPFVNSSDTNTNLKTDGVNRHEYHLGQMNTLVYPADYNYGSTYNSRPTCVICHNVHGSTRLAMVRDGKLIGREPGLKIWYNNDDIVTYSTADPNPPTPENLPLSASTGTIWRGLTSENLCSHCHGSDNTLPEYRTPFQNIAQSPTLNWTGETNYQSDGVNPDSAVSGSTFTFRVEYKDTNNDSPNPIEVWVDKNDNGTYEAEEKYAMTGIDAGDIIYTDGKLYTRSISISSAGDNILSYRFYASDGTNDATGTPTSGGTITILNNAPTLSWTGEAYFTSDGVNPDTGGSGASYEFRIKYTDADNTAPSSIQIWIDEDDDGSYEVGEKYTMTQVNPLDTTYSDGKLYRKSLTLSYAGDGNLNYRFYASDGSDTATGSPATSDSTVTVMSSANNPPYLDWVPEECRTNGVKPVMGLATGDFEFKIKYTDADNQCPPTANDIQVWIDIDDNGTYESNEKYNLTEDDVGDTDCTDGKVYKLTTQLGYAGDGNLNYRFYASDGSDTATGSPATSDSTVTVVSTANTKGVRPGAETGPTWYGSIQSAIDAVNGAHTVLVYEGTYNEDIIFNGSNDNSTTVQSVCGADSTIINGSGTTYVLYFLSNTGSVVDGFQITGGTTGVYLNGSSTTITNSKIHGNTNSGGTGGGIYASNSSSILTLSNSEVYSNSAVNGAGVAFNWGTGHTITNSIIRNNTASGVGGGVFVQGTVTFTDTTIRDNTSTGSGAGVYSNGSTTNFYRCTITGNVSSDISGALHMSNSGTTAYFENSIIANNQGTQGGAVYVNGGTLTAINSTFADNQATTGNGGVFYNVSGNITVRNSILWNNLAAVDGHIAYFNDGSMTITDSIIANGGDGIFTDAPYFEGNVTPAISGYTSENDPLFVDASSNDYHIQSSSDAIDNANATYAPVDDIDGDSRPQGSADDIGADEYTSSSINAPVLAWTGEPNYANDGVNPDSAAGESSFEFRINYTDADNDPPTSVQIWVDEDDDGTYESSERYEMTAVNVDTIYTDGKLYTKTITLSYAGDGTLNYRFYASDGTYDAIGAPTSDNIVSINYAPTLTWTGETNYVSDGVNPDSGESGSSFEFRIKYTDADNQAPTSIQVWVDEDDSGTYDAGEKYDMTEVDSGDTTFTDGKLYTKTLNISSAGDDTLNYRFYASDGIDDATGIPTSDSTISIVQTLLVPSVYPTIQDAINVASNGDTILVSDGIYSENINYNGKNITVRSVNGAAVTTIQGDGSDAPVVTFSNGESSSAVLDGFTIDNQGSGGASMRGIYITSDSSPTIRNSVIRGNNPAYYNGGGANIYIDGGGINIENTTIGGVSGTLDSCVYGAGIYAKNASTKAITITGSTISYNSSDAGAGIYLANRTTTTTISSTTFSNNSASQYGGAIYSTNSPLEITGSTVSNNTSTYDGAGLYLTGSSTTATITGTSFTGNSGRNGGGVYANGISTVSISDTTIDANTGSGYGAGMYLVNMAGNISMTNTDVTNNTGTAGGAGIYFTSSSSISFTLTNCNINNNTVTNTGSYDGGGLYLSGASVTVSVTGGTINNNITRGGGGIYAVNGVDLIISGTTINSNDADSNGGGISIAGTIDYTSTLDISKCVISGNVADDYGGGIYIGAYATATITNCTITGNLVETGYDGGGIYDGGIANIYSSTIAGNYAKRYGGGLRANASTTVTNSIIWGNAAGTSGSQITGTPGSITYSDIQGGGFAGAGNIDSDPLFVDEQAATSTTPTTSGDFHISSLVSPVVDTGTATDSPTDDIDGDSRPLGSGYEMGSDEYVPPAPAVPTLDWTGETNYITDGVNPDSAAGGSNFEFRIKYTDVNNDIPTSIQVWVDEDDSGTYEIDEKYDMTEVDAGDTNRTDGKLYTKTLSINKAGDGILNYRFYAADGTGDATGTPTSDSTVTVVDSLDVPGEYATIQAAINAASDGDIVLVSDGTYSENINYNGKNITVQSVNGAGSTIIQGSGANAAVVTFNTGETSSAVLDGFTIDNQAASTATRGIYISGATPTIRNSIIQGNSASNGTDGGGGVYIIDSVPSFDNVTIRANWADNRSGCGMYIKGAGSGAIITNSTIGGTTSGDGNNCTNGTGGGIYYTGSTTGTLSISDSNIQYNQSATDGAGLYLINITNTITITNTTILNNTAGSSGNGGGIYANNAPLSITGGSISNNTSGVWRGGGGLYIESTTATITGTTINSNSTGSGGGGGIYIGGTAPTLTLSKCYIQGNTADNNGGGINIAAGTATITNCTITGNAITADWRYGGGISNSGTLYLYSSTISGNYVQRDGGGLNAGGTETIRNSIIWGNIANAGSKDSINGTAETVEYSDIEGGYAGAGNINADPLFVNGQQATGGTPTTAGDFHIQSGSPVIDQGTATDAPVDDIDGDSRPQGPGYDMGSDERLF